MLSGTPLFDGIEDLKGELNFLRLEPFSAKTEDGFFKFMVRDNWDRHGREVITVLKNLSSVLLRRSKSMMVVETGEPLLGLPELTVEYHPVHQSSSERALYYYLESVVAREMRGEEQTANGRKSKKVCLKLLRDMCNSAVLINGGLGVPSQLLALNRLLLRQARMAYKNSDEPVEAKRVMNCDEAIMHLAQIQESTRAGTDQVSGLALGFGQGVSRRARANATAEEKLEETLQDLNREQCRVALYKKERAKLRWKWALEKVTTGSLPGFSLSAARIKFRSLWRWRSCFGDTERAPSFLKNGWKASEKYVSTLATRHPDFSWVHENSYQLDSIPSEVSSEEVTAALMHCLVKKDCCKSCELATKDVDDADLLNYLAKNDWSSVVEVTKLGTFPAISKDHTSSTWKAGLRFKDSKHATIISRMASRKPLGVSLPCAPDVPQAKRELAKATEVFEKAKEANTVRDRQTLDTPASLSSNINRFILAWKTKQRRTQQRRNSTLARKVFV